MTKPRKRISDRSKKKIIKALECDDKTASQFEFSIDCINEWYAGNKKGLSKKIDERQISLFDSDHSVEGINALPPICMIPSKILPKC